MKNLFFFILLLLSTAASSQCLQLQNCPSNVPVCDYTVNDAGYWNELYWFDNVNQLHDLADAPVDVSVSVRGTCGSNVTLRYLLFLDLDNDGIQETVVKSWEAPDSGRVNFNNYNNPDYTGGIPRTFDERPVTMANKYQFALKTQAMGDTLRGYLRWNTFNNPDTYAIPQLPYGTHKIKWLVEDDMGNNAVCEYTLTVKDCKAPTVVCLNGLSVNIMPTQMITLWGSDFLQYSEDNATPGNILKYGVRKAGQGTGFPEDGNGDPLLSVNFDCTELGTQFIELWSKDASGNADYCQTYVIVQDNMGNCGDTTSAPIAPTVHCINGLTANITPVKSITLSADDFLQYATDDQTAPQDLDIAIRKAGTGIGFPSNAGVPIQQVNFTCDELGVQLIEIWARDEDDNADYCQTYVIIEDGFDYCNGGVPDTSAPVVVCLNGLSANILPTQQVELFASDFLAYAYDDITPALDLSFAITKGTSSDFPVDAGGQPIQSITFDCNDLGTQAVQLWVRDQSGKTSYCNTFAEIQDNASNCGQNLVNIIPCITQACTGSPVSGVNILINGSFAGAVGPTDAGGCAVFPIHAEANGTLEVAPSLTNAPLNGVTVFDLIKMKRFILDLDSDLTPYEILAADVNRSGTVSGLDIIELRKLILGATLQTPENFGWRFMDANYQFSDPQDPFQGFVPSYVELQPVANSSYQVEFKAFKVGDLDCDATPGAQQAPEDRLLPENSISLPDIAMSAGKNYDITLQMDQAGDWYGLQAGLQFNTDKIEVLQALPGALRDFTDESIAQPSPNELRMIWFYETPQPIDAGQGLLHLRVHAITSCKLSEVVHSLPGFEQLGSNRNGNLKLALKFRPSVAFDQTIIPPPSPNPTTEGASIALELMQTGTVQLEVSDLRGVVVLRKSLELEAGSHLIDIPATVLTQTGVYSWRLKAGDKTAGGRLIKSDLR